MATGPGDEPAAAGRDRPRAGHADREQVISTLKAAFVQGMLAKDEFDARVSQAFASRTCAELAAVTADLPAGLVAARSARPPVRVRRRPLARAAAGAGGYLTIAAAAVWGAGILDPGPFARGTAGPPRGALAGPDVCHRPLRRAGGTRFPVCRDGQLIGAAALPRAAATPAGAGRPRPRRRTRRWHRPRPGSPRTRPRRRPGPH
jgi:hypothetical protein